MYIKKWKLWVFLDDYMQFNGFLFIFFLFAWCILQLYIYAMCMRFGFKAAGKSHNHIWHFENFPGY